uniref:Uncharacterized protein n=1 Tax=Oryza brachyantha TaxID=4533 RepID=J3N5K6_ORYBR
MVLAPDRSQSTAKIWWQRDSMRRSWPASRATAAPGGGGCAANQQCGNTKEQDSTAAERQTAKENIHVADKESSSKAATGLAVSDRAQPKPNNWSTPKGLFVSKGFQSKEIGKVESNV